MSHNNLVSSIFKGVSKDGPSSPKYFLNCRQIVTVSLTIGLSPTRVGEKGSGELSIDDNE